MTNKDIPGIKPTTTSKEEAKLIADRKEWQAKYEHWLKRKNAFALKLQAAGRQIESSPRYSELKAETQKYFQLLRDSLPAYKSIFNKGNQ